MKLNWKSWIYGLIAGTVGGACSAALSWGGMAAAHDAGVDVPLLNFKALGIILISGAAPSFFAYLKQSPLPPLVAETTTTVIVTEKKTALPVEPTAPEEPKKEP